MHFFYLLCGVKPLVHVLKYYEMLIYIQNTIAKEENLYHLNTWLTS